MNNPADTLPQDLREFEGLRSRSYMWQSLYSELSRFFLPTERGFISRPIPGQPLASSGRVYDPTGVYVAEQLSSGLLGLITPASAPWFALQADTDFAGRAWLDEVTNIIYSHLSDPRSGFYVAISELLLDIVVFGMGVLAVERLEGRLTFRPLFLGDCEFAQGPDGLINTMYRVFRMSNANVSAKFGVAPAHEPYEEVELLQVIRPGKAKHGRAFVSRVWNLTTKVLLREGGFDSFPFVVPRWRKSSFEVRGRSPAMAGLPTAKLLSQVAKTTIEAAQLAVRPPLQVPDDGFIGKIRTGPSAINYYRADTSGRISKIDMGENPQIGVEFQQGLRNDLLRLFYNDLFQLPGQTTTGKNAYLSAREVSARERAMGTGLSPIVERFQRELVGPVLRLAYAEYGSSFPPAPPSLSKGIKVEYVSPLAQAQREQSAGNLDRFIRIVEPIAAADPDVLLSIDPVKLGIWASQLTSVPAEIRRTPAEITAVLAEKSQQQQQAAAAETGVNQTQGVLNVAQANLAMKRAQT